MYISLFVAMVVCFGAILVLRPVAVSWGLVDTPDNRKQHIGHIPLTGGLAIYLATLTSASLYLERSQHINLVLVSISLMVFVGALDDRYDLSAKLRLVAQVLIASVLTFGTDIQLHTFGNIFGFGEIVTGPLAGITTVLAIVAGINAFNMTDGIDGLAGTLALISLCAIGFIVTDMNLKFLIGIVSVCLITFLLFNLGILNKKNKIFMGDAGSMMLGLIVSWLLIVSTQKSQVEVAPVHVLWFIAVPLIDMIAVMFRRIRNGKSPLIADREHLHHVFMDVGLSSKVALFYITGLGVIFAVVGLVIIKAGISQLYSMLGFILVFIIYNILLDKRHLIGEFLKLKKKGS